jgi:hypothetical protein
MERTTTAHFGGHFGFLTTQTPSGGGFFKNVWEFNTGES